MTQAESTAGVGETPLAFRRVAEGERATAFRQLGLADASMSDRAVRRKVEATESTGVAMHYLWGAFDERDRMLASAWLMPQPGRTAMLFVCRPPGQRGVGVVARLVDRLCTEPPRRDVVLVQALIETTHDLEEAALARAGFDRLATLCYLQAPVRAARPDARPPAGVELLAYHDDLRPQFLDALSASYIDTRDCPALRGLRDGHDVLTGHSAAGRFDPDLWTLALVRGQPAGVCLLNAIDETGGCELVYLGVAHGHRRTGLASLLLRRAFALADQHGYGVITLAVDESNAPAADLYRRFGFHRTGRKLAMIRAMGAEG